MAHFPQNWWVSGRDRSSLVLNQKLSCGFFKGETEYRLHHHSCVTSMPPKVQKMAQRRPLRLWSGSGNACQLSVLSSSSSFFKCVLYDVYMKISFELDSVQFNRSFVSNSLRPYELQHATPPCPSPTPRVYSNSCPSSW